MAHNHLTQQQIQSERAVFLAFAFDLMIAVPYTWIAFGSGSVTMLAEVLRGVLLISVAIASWFTIRRIHRGRTGGFDFGLGKQEQLLSMAVATLLLASVVFVAWKAFTKAPEQQHGIDFYAAGAVVLVFANFLANIAPVLPLWRASRNGSSVIVTTQLRAKIAKSLGSVFVVASVAVSQLSGDALVALWADRVGTVFVIMVTLHAAWDLMHSALPDLLDRTVAEPLQIRINRILAERFDSYDSLEWCRSRQSGSRIEIHLGLGFDGDMPFRDVAAMTRGFVDQIEGDIQNSSATVTAVLASWSAPER